MVEEVIDLVCVLSKPGLCGTGRDSVAALSCRADVVGTVPQPGISPFTATLTGGDVTGLQTNPADNQMIRIR